jgi:hypothetical protein
MTLSTLAQLRLRNQRLTGPPCPTAAEVVQCLGAVQSQDYAGAKWAVAQRTTGLTDAAIDREFDRGSILRTHVMRPTWHFVTPSDIVWLLALTAPRVQAFNAYYYRQFELNARVFARSHAVLVKALQGGRHLTRTELAAKLQQARIAASGIRLGLLMMHAELERVICSGPRRGKQFTYALLEERAPNAGVLPREEALAELTRRYVASHGPATLKDYAWWSGLSAADVKAGVEMIKSELEQATIDGRVYWFAASAKKVSKPSPTVFLLPNYDEYFIAYKDRHLVQPLPAHTKDARRARDPFVHQIAIDGWLAGSWLRRPNAKSVDVALATYNSVTGQQRKALAAAADRFARFLGRPVALSPIVRPITGAS